jgi:hypothetical protein
MGGHSGKRDMVMQKKSTGVREKLARERQCWQREMHERGAVFTLCYKTVWVCTRKVKGSA